MIGVFGGRKRATPPRISAIRIFRGLFVQRNLRRRAIFLDKNRTELNNENRALDTFEYLLRQAFV
jgi:hypothetical protein